MTTSPAWRELEIHHQRIKSLHLTQLFDRDPLRFQNFSGEAAGLFIDYSRNIVDREVMGSLFLLAAEAGFASRREAMFRGDEINSTEGRSVMHFALRDPHRSNLAADRSTEIIDTLARMARCSQQIRAGAWLGATGRPIRTIVSLGIGGSYLGPKMAWEALAASQSTSLTVEFVANIDPDHLNTLLRGMNAEETLFIVISKSFSTLETLENAKRARQWLTSAGIEDLSRHLLAVSANVPAASAFGIDADNVFPMWDWVGGRFSLWSAAGLPLMIGLGVETFNDLLSGAATMDRHFETAPPEHNLPLILALLGVWYVNFCGADSHAILPYSHALRVLPAFLQQLDMESNGKSVTLEGNPVHCQTAPVIWGGEGTNGQHAFFQLLHQGQRLIPVDFVLPLPEQDRTEASDWLIANCIGQGRALMVGQSHSKVISDLLSKGMSLDRASELAPHKVMPGNRPSTTIVLPKLDAKHLGALIALYEHKVFCQGAIWQINSFDQWGVELGKALSEDIYPYLQTEQPPRLDGSTDGLIALSRQAGNRVTPG